MTESQRRMLAMVARAWDGAGLAEVVMEHSTGSALDTPLAWRNSDRTAGACLRRGWMVLRDGEWCELTEAGRAALAAARG